MKNLNVSPMKSPNLQKPKISFIYAASPLKERNIQNSYNVNHNRLTSDYSTGNLYHQKQFINDQKPNRDNSLRYFHTNHNANQQNSLSRISNLSIKTDFIEQKCEKCNKRKQSYRLVKQNFKFCSNCALQEMKNGKQICNINQANQKRSYSPHCKQIKQKCLAINQKCIIFQKSNQLVIKQFIKTVNDSSTKINDLLKENIFKQNSVRQTYNNKRHLLKQHYEKLKQIIQVSIKKDLQFVKQQQQEEIILLRSEITHLNQNVKSIQRMKQQISQSNLKQSLQQQMMVQFAKNNSSLLTRILKEPQIQSKQINSQSIINMNMNCFVYKPELFMLTNSNPIHKNNNNNNNFNYNNNNSNQSTNYSEHSKKRQLNPLFSFQRRS